MNNEDRDQNTIGATDISQRAVSLYGQNEGMDDFPVLKAFQQYIDAEQEKARKRLLNISIFFGVFLIVVIAVFMVLLHGINARNQALSDRLVEYAMSGANGRANSQYKEENDTALKAMTETLVTLQKQLVEKQNAPVKEQKSAEESESIRKAKALLEVEKEKLAVERERMRQFEIDRQRRKLYPELYQDEDVRVPARKSKVDSPSRGRTLTDEDIREILREAYSKEDDDAATKPEQTEAPKAKKQESSDGDDAIEYYKDDEYTIPVDVKGGTSKLRFTVGIE